MLTKGHGIVRLLVLRHLDAEVPRTGEEKDQVERWLPVRLNLSLLDLWAQIVVGTDT